MAENVPMQETIPKLCELVQSFVSHFIKCYIPSFPIENTGHCSEELARSIMHHSSQYLTHFITAWDTTYMIYKVKENDRIIETSLVSLGKNIFLKKRHCYLSLCHLLCLGAVGAYFFILMEEPQQVQLIVNLVVDIIEIDKSIASNVFESGGLQGFIHFCVNDVEKNEDETGMMRLHDELVNNHSVNTKVYYSSPLVANPFSLLNSSKSPSRATRYLPTDALVSRYEVPLTKLNETYSAASSSKDVHQPGTSQLSSNKISPAPETNSNRLALQCLNPTADISPPVGSKHKEIFTLDGVDVKLQLETLDNSLLFEQTPTLTSHKDEPLSFEMATLTEQPRFNMSTSIESLNIENMQSESLVYWMFPQGKHKYVTLSTNTSCEKVVFSPEIVSLSNEITHPTSMVATEEKKVSKGTKVRNLRSKCSNNSKKKSSVVQAAPNIRTNAVAISVMRSTVIPPVASSDAASSTNPEPIVDPTVVNWNPDTYSHPSGSSTEMRRPTLSSVLSAGTTVDTSCRELRRLLTQPRKTFSDTHSSYNPTYDGFPDNNSNI